MKAWFDHNISLVTIEDGLLNMERRAISFRNKFLMIALITFWGSSFIVVKIALKEGLTPISIATFRFLIAGGLFLPILLTARVRQNLKHDFLLVNLRDLPKFLFLSLSGVTVFFAAQYTGIQMAGATIASILVCLLSPIFITLFSIALFGEHLSRKQFLGVGIAAAGTFAIIAGGTLDFQDNQQFLFGSFILLLTPALWTAYTLSGKKIMENYDPLVVVALTTLLGGLLLVPFSVAENSLEKIFALSIGSWLAILYLSIACSLIGYYIWFHVISQVKAAITSSFLFAEPLVTGLLAIALVEEKVTIPIGLGGLLVFLGVYIVTKNKH